MLCCTFLKQVIRNICDQQTISLTVIGSFYSILACTCEFQVLLNAGSTVFDKIVIRLVEIYCQKLCLFCRHCCQYIP